MANKEKVVVVNEGATYEAKNADTQGEKTRVVAFHVDRPRSTVQFAPLGSGREDRLSVDEFLNTYTLVAQQGEPLPENKAENDKAQARAEREAKDAQANATRAPKLDTTKASPTREALEARATARNER